MSVPRSHFESALHRENEPALPAIVSATGLVAELGNTIIRNSRFTSPPPIPSPTGQRPHEHRVSSSTSRVDIGHFDPLGVEELRRTLSKSSGAPSEPGHSAESSRQTYTKQAGTSDTLEDSFNFEHVLREVLKKPDGTDTKSRELGVLFDQLRVVGKGAAASFQPTLGSIFNPLDILRAIQSFRHPHMRTIVNGFQGVVRPGEMLLVLGRPGSGCSTLLKVLANQRHEFELVEGDIHYNSLSPDDIRLLHRGDVQYCPEHDIHFPTLTVEQTVSFAAKSRAPRARADGLTRKGYWTDVTDILTTVFGLRNVRKSPVGDAALRGVSGGEKKRVSISESLATRSLVTCWDNSTRGLDASTAVEYVRALRIATDIARLATIVTFSQAGESLYATFDKICLIYEGRMVYFGPANQAKQYFIDMGYVPANRQTTADFLVAVTDPYGRVAREGMTIIPATAAEFEEYYKKSGAMKSNQADMDSFREHYVGKQHLISAFQESTRAERSRHTNLKSPYMTSIPMQIRAVMVRRIQILRGSLAAQVINVIAFVLQAIILGTTYLELSTNTSDFYSRGGVIFFAVFLPGLFAMSEIPSLFAQRPIIQRQKKLAMYHPFVEAIALTLVDIPVTFFIVTIFSIILYFLVGLQRSAGQFFVFLLFELVIALFSKSLFRMIASAFKAEAPAQCAAGIIVLAVALYTGYFIPQASMIGALRWISYINPGRYSFEALLVNEFHTINGLCGIFVPSGPGYDNFPQANKACITVGSQPGDLYVDGNRFVQLSFGYSYGHLWRDFGIVMAFGVFFAVLLLVFSEYNTSLTGQTSRTLFKRGSRTPAVLDSTSQTSSTDEEKTRISSTVGSESDSRREEVLDIKSTLIEPGRVTNVFTWRNISYEISGKLLLNDVSGFVAPGKLTALMGESGAGKTTLLNVLAERTDVGVVSGDRFVNGHPLSADFQAQTGYCQQTDTHMPTMTVREALLFSAKLRRPLSVSMEEKEAYVDNCLAVCGLDAYRDAVVGSLSAEYKKRTTIGVELAAKPKLLLFLDEPTSGLDSQSAWAIVSFLRSLANSGQAILCTIHQPSAELFQVFDRLLLLRKGGETVYFGDVGSNAATVIQYFERNGSRPCEAHENPAEFILDAIGAGTTAYCAIDWYHVWQRSAECNLLESDIDGIHAKGRSIAPVSASIGSAFATPWLYQTWTLLMRNFADHWRDPTYLMAKLVLNVAAGLFMGFTFFKRNETLEGAQDKLYSIYVATIISVPLANQLQVVFLRLRDIYEIRERPSKMYAWSALVTSQVLVELPWNTLGSTLFFFCWYWTVGFQSDRGAYTYLVLGVLFPVYYTTIGQAVAAMSPTAEIAGIVFSFLFSFVLTFNGVLQPYSKLGWWRWMYRMSPFTYLIEGLAAQVLGGHQIRCSATELAVVQPPSGYSCIAYLGSFVSAAGGYLVNPDATINCEYCSESTADDWLERVFNIKYTHRWRNVGILCAFIVFNIAMVYLCTYLFRVRTYGKTKSFLKSGGFRMGKDKKTGGKRNIDSSKTVDSDSQ
ncbi:hypothetical protein HYDPIDRAFT_132105 [Hydnomerulius pinastri MD-312]|uniref:ABC transporter domain-containing protein n=1 Tax=Hydnomerulius pinastri MD-312 TaxID=994086 RepID=A0A0C9W1U0_9AGAM|nr:hypothetical protein HYDPIDRAFT_132105 [Hydnomerulius pinastri MD-312]